MSENKHTPGPWLVNTKQNSFTTFIYKDEIIPGYIAEVPTGLSNYTAVTNAEGIANAQLIAASPDLKESLLELLDEINKIGFPLDIKPDSLVTAMGKSMRAIAKSEGF